MTSQPQLMRAIGRWSMVALAVNTILGSAIFGLPSIITAAVGNASPWVVLLGGLVMIVIVLCYAEVASQFTSSGGSYLYVRYTFGQLAGIQVGWQNLITRLSAYAAAVNLFVQYLGQFYPDASQPVPRLFVITLMVGLLAIVNYRGVGGGATVSNVTVVAKLLPLGLLAVLGMGYLVLHPGAWVQPAAIDVGGGFKALLLLFFAYGGYEAVLISVGEAKDPRRDAPVALLVSIVIITLLYTLLQLTVVAVLPDPAHSDRPLADAAGVLIGPHGATLVAGGALISVVGFLSAHMLTGSRSLFALAEFGDFPAKFAAVHPRFRTPHISIVTFAFCIWVFALLGSFAWNATLSAVGRLCYYGAVCAAVPVLRRRQPEAATFRVPGGLLFPVLGVLICGTLLTHVDFSKSMILLATVVVGLLNWLVVRKRVNREYPGPLERSTPRTD